jgi:hypothetical protein
MVPSCIYGCRPIPRCILPADIILRANAFPLLLSERFNVTSGFLQSKLGTVLQRQTGAVFMLVLK